MTQQELAEAAETDKGYIGRLEAGTIAEPGIEVLSRLAKALRVPVRALADPRYCEDEHPTDLEVAIMMYPSLDEDAKRSLIRIFRSLEREPRAG